MAMRAVRQYRRGLCHMLALGDVPGLLCWAALLWSTAPAPAPAIHVPAWGMCLHGRGHGASIGLRVVGHSRTAGLNSSQWRALRWQIAVARVGSGIAAVTHQPSCMHWAHDCRMPRCLEWLLRRACRRWPLLAVLAMLVLLAVMRSVAHGSPATHAFRQPRGVGPWPEEHNEA